jgi:uncharacterized protein (DUF362 family)
MPFDAQRRRFLRGIAGLGVSLWGLAPAGCLGRDQKPSGPAEAPPSLAAGKAGEGHPSSRRSRVVVIRHRRCFRVAGQPDPGALREMLEGALCELTGAGTVSEAWQHFFQPQDRIGLKLNCLSGRNLSSRPELVAALAEGLVAAGIPASHILAWDRTDRELQQAGYPIRVEGPDWLCFGTDHPGVGYEEELTLNGSIGGLLSTILTRRVTAQINVPVLKDHGLAGVSGGLKNNYGCIHNPNKYHDNHCDPYVADLNALPVLREKQRLVVCDATTVQYHGGPGYKPQWAEPYGALLVATDPVAVDAVGARIVARLRAAHNLPSLEDEGRPAQHIATAAAAPYHLGVCDEQQIEVVEVTV